MAMLRKIASDSLAEIFIKILSVSSIIAFNATVTRVLSMDQVGLYFFYFSVIHIGTVIFILGIDKKIIYHVAEWLARGEVKIIHKYLRFLGAFIFISLVLVTFVLYTVSSSPIRSFFELNNSKIIIYLILWFWMLITQRILNQVLRGFDIIKASAFYETLNFVISFFTLAAIRKLDYNLSVEHLLMVVCFSLLFSNIAAVINVFTVLRRNLALKSKSDQSEAISYRIILLSTATLYLQSLLMVLMEHGQLWILKFFKNPEEVAVFGAITRLIIPISAGILVLRRVLAPKIMKLFADGKLVELEHLLRLTTTTAGTLSILAYFVLLFPFGESILAIIFGEQYREGYIALLMISFANIINVSTGLPGAILIATNRERYSLGVSFLSGMLGTSISFALVDLYSYNGIALGISTGLVFHNFLMTYLVWKFEKIKTYYSVYHLLNVLKYLKKLKR